MYFEDDRETMTQDITYIIVRYDYILLQVNLFNTFLNF